MDHNIAGSITDGAAMFVRNSLRTACMIMDDALFALVRDLCLFWMTLT